MLEIALASPGPIPLDARLTLAAGEIVALVGSSGAGKTTLLRAIAGLHAPVSGRIIANGTAWLESAAGVALPPHQRRAGFVFQSYALFPHLTALQNIMAALPKGAGQHAAAEALLAEMGLADLAGRLPAALSGGQQQRVALARALARAPDVLLLDEPFAATDRPVRRALIALLARLRARAPMLIVTHDIEDAALVADRLCLIERGQTVETGATADLLGDPQSRLRRWLDGPAGEG
jgi:molybdate transport system ATP-binding protein